MRIFELTKTFPMEERYSLTDQVRGPPRAVCAIIAEAWRIRRYPANWVSKLSDSEAEAGEAETWIQFAIECGYLKREIGDELHNDYDAAIGMLVYMIRRPENWSI